MIIIIGLLICVYHSELIHRIYIVLRYYRRKLIDCELRLFIRNITQTGAIMAAFRDDMPLVEEVDEDWDERTTGTQIMRPDWDFSPIRMRTMHHLPHIFFDTLGSGLL